MREKGVCDPEIAFCVFKIDGIYLMRHGRRAYLTLLQLLPEEFHRDIGPHITAEIKQDRIDPSHGIEPGSQVIIMLDLGSVLGALKFEGLIYKTVGKAGPV